MTYVWKHTLQWQECKHKIWKEIMTYWVPFTVSRNDTQEIGCHTIMKPIYHYLQPTYYIILGKKSGVSQGFFLKKIWQWKILCLKFPIADYLCEIPLRNIFYIGLLIYMSKKQYKLSINSWIANPKKLIRNTRQDYKKCVYFCYLFWLGFIACYYYCIM